MATDFFFRFPRDAEKYKKFYHRLGQFVMSDLNLGFLSG